MTLKKIRNMEEFAKVSGISRPTVSKYFHDPSSVRANTRQRIETALEAYDYRPNIFAMNQNRKLTKTIGIVVPYLSDPFFAEIVRVIEVRCRAAGFSPSLFSSQGEADHEAEILDALRALKPAGVLFAPLGRGSDKRVIEAFCKDVPTILFDSNIDGLGEAFVGSDQVSFVSQAVEYLSRTGEPPCFLQMLVPPNPNANKRLHAYRVQMQVMGLEPQVTFIKGIGWDLEKIGHDAAGELLANNALPSNTVLCSNDRLAIGVLAACFEAGVSVGRTESDRMRVAGLDDHPFARFTCPSLTTAAHDYTSISEQAVSLLFQMVEGGGSLTKRTERFFEPRLIMRNSA